ncbi:MAG: M18 family aminopeptidase [Acidimicrobiales bacterium]
MESRTGQSSDGKSPNFDQSTLAGQVLADLAISPTPYHAVARAEELLVDSGFQTVDLDLPLPTQPGPYLVVDGGSLMAWIQQPKHNGFTVVGAHTDSPNLRVKSRPDVTSANFEQIGMEIYGGVLLNSWLDRGLGLAGRVSVATDEGVKERLFLDDRPLMCIPQLAIHLDREIMSAGLKLDPQRHLTPFWSLANPDDDEADTDGDEDGENDGRALRAHVADLLDVTSDDILAWDLMAFDTNGPELIGRNADMFSSARIDNLLSSFCGVRALVDLQAELSENAAGPGLAKTPLLALYDHEEVGSTSATGAASTSLGALLERVALAEGASRSEYLAALNRSLVISADGAHATHPNYKERHEPSHHIALNAGVVIKRNANQRYATDAASEAFIVDVCRSAGVPLQFYIHRNDLPCGSTIGPITAAGLGVSTVDIGAPQLAMHSIRETAGVADIGHLSDTLGAAWRHGA